MYPTTQLQDEVKLIDEIDISIIIVGNFYTSYHNG